jgi:hypothetical protein
MEWERDKTREDLFNSAHHIKPEIYIRYSVDESGIFEFFFLKFKFMDREYLMQEYYAGRTNLTDVVRLIDQFNIYEFRNPKGAFNDAEHKLVEIMKKWQHLPMDIPGVQLNK